MVIEKDNLTRYTEKVAYDLLERLTTGARCMYTKEQLFNITVKSLANFGLSVSHDTKLSEECAILLQEDSNV